MKKLLFITALFIAGCSSECSCKNENCGPLCRLQCFDNRCTPGMACCDKCTCKHTEKIN